MAGLRRTKMSCPKCRRRTSNSVVPGSRSGIGSVSGDLKDPQCYRRRRRCGGCGGEWDSVELPESFVDDLILIREELGRLQFREMALVSSFILFEEKYSALRDAVSGLANLMNQLDAGELVVLHEIIDAILHPDRDPDPT